MFKIKSSFVSLAVLLLATNASASSLTDALIDRGNFTFDPTKSYDGPGRNTISLFTAFSDGNVYELGTIASQSTSVTYTASLISELSAFSGGDAIFQGEFTNKFGYVNSGGSFVSLIDSANNDALTEVDFTQAAGQDFNFALKSPEGLFYGKDSLNPDGQLPHMLGIKVANAGTINLTETTLYADHPLSFNLQVGDIVLFMEDLVGNGNIKLALSGDFDFNDMVIVLKAENVSQVPEPATTALLTFGMLGGLMRRKRNC